MYLRRAQKKGTEPGTGWQHPGRRGVVSPQRWCHCLRFLGLSCKWVSAPGGHSSAAQVPIPCGTHIPKIHGAVKLFSKKKKKPTTEQLDLKELYVVPWGSANSDGIGLGKGDHKVMWFSEITRVCWPLLADRRWSEHLPCRAWTKEGGFGNELGCWGL